MQQVFHVGSRREVEGGRAEALTWEPVCLLKAFSL